MHIIGIVDSHIIMRYIQTLDSFKEIESFIISTPSNGILSHILYVLQF